MRRLGQMKPALPVVFCAERKKRKRKSGFEFSLRGVSVSTSSQHVDLKGLALGETRQIASTFYPFSAESRRKFTKISPLQFLSILITKKGCLNRCKDEILLSRNPEPW